jgi:hypothetical protein
MPAALESSRERRSEYKQNALILAHLKLSLTQSNRFEKLYIHSYGADLRTAGAAWDQ